jgi:hypothetical protein
MPPPVSNENSTASQNNNTTSQTVAPPTRIPRLTITVPPRSSLCHSPQLQGLLPQPPAPQTPDYAVAFLSEYADVQDMHDLFPTELCFESQYSVDDVLTALGDGSLEPSIDADDDPSWAQAMASNEREYWIAGRRDELKSLEDLKVFVLVPRSDVPCGQRPLKGKLICKCKHNDTGRIVRYKVCYIMKGFAQRYGVDFDKTTAPTVCLESFCALIHLASSLDWDLKQFDIKTTFLHGVLPEEETMFLEQPPGFETLGKEEWVMRLMKSIYSM